ncbi:uncharacterized protein SPPG_09457 [Spizellomyces punctatus DAOM BR117]|uniref:Autophagy-related protein 16 domain-containing protein n=1 Tax=Spizellomyces punctatus (strain DAOM BR117) TaxID=645134 RepID=A0A0L0H8R1_SPIPD|nr:uncharacterized protein SPPG_09457 [Spizellomyces punctatus DAOM BR117]KNC97324.1 hypothetical protein SPPG_09457 [Spizellomyces punctatus DAOM BR117]|eukprot:XP_016605364.1 hypothetical protein SPPG_09457 [Spizellomyces punctatus DAOM BR117]
MAAPLAITPSVPTWHTKILKRLADRDRREREAFADLFTAHNAFRDTLSNLESKLSSLRIEHAQAVKTVAAVKDFGSADSAQRFAELEQQVTSLKEERTELYKTQGQNAQKLLELMEALQKGDGKIASLEEENQTLTTSLASVNTRLRDLQELIREKDHVIQILRDELATHQLELVQREEQLKEKEEKLNKLESENKQLIERWILLKQEQAARMNEANEFVANALKSKATSPPVSRQTSAANVYDDQSPQPVVRTSLPQAAVKKIHSHDSEINCIQISPDGSLLATGSNDKKVILYDAKAGVVKATLSGSLQGIMSLAFNNGSELVMGTSNDNSVKIWNVGTGRLKHTLTGHIGKVYAAKFTDSNCVISGSHDRTIKIWDLAKGFCTSTIFTLSSCNDLTLLNGDGTVIASGHLDNNIRIWDTRSGSLVRELTGIHHGQITSVTMSPTQNILMTTSRDNTLKLIDLSTYQTVGVLSHDQFRPGMNWLKSSYSPDGKHIVSGSADGSVFIWNVMTGRVDKILKEHKSAVCGVVWSPQGGSTVYSAEKDKTVVFWGASA